MPPQVFNTVTSAYWAVTRKFLEAFSDKPTSVTSANWIVTRTLISLSVQSTICYLGF